MSATFTPQLAVDYAAQMIKSMPINTVGSLVCQQASNFIWTAAPWRWTIGTLSPITMVAGNQEHSIVSAPTDFLCLEQCYEADSISLRAIKPVSSLPPSATMTRLPNYVAISSITNATPATIRFEALYPSIQATKTPKFWAWYKKIAPILSADLNTPGALIMDDDYYQVYTEWVLYYAYRYADDQRAGGAQISVTPDGKKQTVYTGQLGVARAALEELRQDELVLYSFPVVPSTIKDS